MGDPIKPGAEGLGDLKGFQPAKCVEPNFLMQVERVVGVRDEAAQIIEQRFFVPIHEANEGVSVACLSFSDPERFFKSGKLLLGRTCFAGIHRYLMVSRSGRTVQTFLLMETSPRSARFYSIGWEFPKT
jgi:hypothetical protein